MSIQEQINNALQPINDAVLELGTYVWYVGLLVVIAAGLFFLFRFRGMQIRYIPEQVKMVFGDFRKSGGSRISSFQSFCLGLGQRIGIGNITGVATAILLGGPGAVFWMCVFAVIGAATCFVESTLGQIYKGTKSNGQYYGGPAYYIQNGFKSRKLAILMVFFTMLTCTVGFVANQAANASSAINDLVVWEHMPAVITVAFVVFTAYLVLGGAVRVAQASEKFVPYMTIIWLGLAFISLIMNIGLVDDIIMLVLTDAFDISKIAAGFAGSCIMWGIRRGVFSNEAGMGTVPCLGSSSDVKHPVHQGYLQSFGVLVDTLMVCTASAFLILTAFPEGLGGLGFTVDDCTNIVGTAMAINFGGDWTKYLLAGLMFVFAFSSVISLYTISETNARFLRDSPGSLRTVKAIVVVAVFLGCVLPISLVWNITDVTMACMAGINIFVLFRMYRYVSVAHDDYRKQKSEGIETPVFCVDTLSEAGLDVSNIVSWDRDREEQSE